MLRDEHARPLECGDSSPLSFSLLSLAYDASLLGFPPQQDRKAMTIIALQNRERRREEPQRTWSSRLLTTPP